MPKTITFEGKNYDFPDDATDAEIGAALQNATASPSFSTVVGAIPGEAKRQLTSSLAGADIAIGDIVGSQTMKERGLGVKKQIAEEAELERPQNMSVLQEGIVQGGASVLTQLPTAVATAVAAPVVAPARLFGLATTVMGAQTGLSTYGDERQAGFLPARSAMHAMIDGLIEKYTEYLPLKELAGSHGLTTMAKRYLVKEFTGEQLATLGQDINAKLSYNPDMTLGEYFRDALITAIATPVAGASQFALARTGQAVAQAFPSGTSAPNLETSPTPGSVPQPTPEPTPATPLPNAAVTAETAVAAPAPTPPVEVAKLAELPKTQTTARVYYVGESQHAFEATLDPVEAAAVQQPVKYVDIPFDQLTELQNKVPETVRLSFDGSTRFGLPKDASLTWKSSLPPQPTVPAKPAGVEPSYVEGVDTPAPVYEAVTVPGAVPINIQSTKARSIKFPDEITKALWNYGAALTRYETTTKPADSTKLNALRDKVKEVTGLTDDALVAEQAQRYTYGVVITGLSQAKNVHFAPNLEVALKAQKSHEEHITAGVGSNVKNGEVALSSDLPHGDQWLKQMQTYLQAWVKTFSPQMRVVVLGVQAGDTTRARTWYYGGTHYVYVPQQQDKVLALYVLAHEFGHMIVSQHLNNPRYAAQKDKLINEYASLISKTEGVSAQEFVEKFRSPIDLLAGQVGPMETASQFIRTFGESNVTFDEWMADQMVRYMHTNRSHLELPSEKGFWKPLFDALKDFFDRVVKKFAPSQTYKDWVESLRLEDSQVAGMTLTAPPSPRVDKSVSHEQNDQFEYTTRVLNRLPNKPLIKKVTIYGELGRADVRKEERELIGRILHDIPGESVDANLFKERVLGEIVPLRLQTTSSYAYYGVDRLGYTFYSSPERVSPETHIWEGRGIDYTSPHFADDSSRYWAHSRGFNDNQARWSIIELQSDLEQRGDAIEEAQARSELGAMVDDLNDYAKRLNNVINLIDNVKDRHAALAELKEALKLYSSITPLNTLRSVEARLSQNLDFIDSAEVGAIVDDLNDVAQSLTLRAAEAEKKLQFTTVVPGALPRRWWELVLRHENTWAARQGYQRIRMASADTVAKAEGWEPEYRVDVPFLKDRSVVAKEDQHLPGEERYTLTGSLFGVYNSDNKNTTWWARAKREDGTTALLSIGALGGTQNRTEGTFSLTSEIGKFLTHPDTRGAIQKSYGKEVIDIYNRYADEVTKFVKREFNAKPVTDSKGNTWFEWETNEALASVPIIYYNTARAVAETGGQVAKQSQVPTLPATFVRFQGFLQNTLQLNQIAKILPEVVGLQRYRTAMRQLHALKAKLFEGPNDRIHEWHKLGRIQAKRVEQALRDEQLSGNHWTALTQTEVDGKMVWVHIPTASFDKLMRDRGISQEGQELFLGVKNDYLSTLSAMEEVVRKHTDSFFEKNEVVLAQRTARANDEFAKLRSTPYLPDMRFGQYSVQVRAGHPETVDGREIKEGELVYWEKFESERERNRRLAELKRTLPGHNVSGSYDSELVSTMRGLPQSVMDAVAETLNSDPSTALTPEQTNALEQIAFDQTAAGKFAKYLGTPAKHIAGSSKDMRRAYAAYHWKTANAIAKLNYFRALTGAMNVVRADARKIRAEGGVSDSYDKLTEYMQKNFNYVMNPQHEFEQLRAFVSLWYLWGSAKTAVMNLTSVPVLTFPYLWARFGNLQAQAALLRAIKNVTQYWRNPEKLSLDHQRVLEQLKADGVTDQSFASMLASVSDGGVAFEKIIPSWGGGQGEAVDVARRMAWKITSMGMAPFRVIEQFNRQITGLAAYDLMVAKTGKTLSSGDTQAYNFARDAVDYTQNEYGAWNRPAMMQGKQSIFLLFFSFVQNMSFLMFGGDKSWWRAMMVLGALAGLQGLPGMDNLLDMFNWAARKLTGQHVDLRNEARTVAREFGLNPDMVMHGISHNWLGLGWDTSTSVGAGRIIPGTDAIFGVGKFEDRFLHATSEIGGPVGSLMLSFLQALADDNPSELLRWDRALPPVMRNIEKAYVAVANDAWVNARGRPVAEDPTNLELLGQTLGFSPTRRTERSEELRAVKDVVEFYKERRANLMEMMYSAKRAHDSEVVQEVRAAIAGFNAGVPSAHLRITPEEISASMKSRDKLDRETAAMRSPQKRYRDIYRYIDELY